ncbi:MAG: hypothetical protein DMG73_21195 [Acidobacteria bacterium]|nr:MAG: hypothetical protein DMG73_21195 [Acidobacteriota bacterium]
MQRHDFRTPAAANDLYLLASPVDAQFPICILDNVQYSRKTVIRLQVALLFLFITLSCSTINHIQDDICNCLAALPDTSDYRHVAKHVPIPSGTPQEIDVATILSWPQDPIPLPFDAPRTGRELQLVHVANAFLENASVNQGDCDIHLEISQTADKNAPRVIIETPIDSEYCTSRKTIQSQLKQHGFQLDLQHGGDLPQPLAVDVLGLPFEDFEHGRGGSQVVTLWEIHPAMATIK